MLQELQIENLALIESLQLNLEPGLTVLTGETGAGKSIIVDAVGLLVGARASGEYIRAGADKAVVRGLFQAAGLPGLKETLSAMGVAAEDDGTLLLCREISRSGRHSCRVNGRSLTLGMYQRIGQMLVDIHGQHAYQSLLRPAYQMDMLDSLAGLMELRQEVGELYTRWQDLKKELEELCGDRGERERQRDFWQYQLQEIGAANLTPGEEEELSRQREILNNGERLARGAAVVYAALFEEEGRSAYDQLSRALAELEALAAIDPGLQTWHGTLEGITAQVEEIARSVRRYGEGLEYDPARLQEIENRLELIKDLKRKYGGSIEAILQYQAETAAALERLEQMAGQAAALEKEIELAAEKYREKALLLRRRRMEAAQKIEKELLKVLKDLAMPAARIRVDCSEAPQPGPAGMDNITFLFQPNPGEGSRPLAQIASGGEMARVMLALKSILADVDAVPTLIFDEIDAGVGGAAARAVARTLAAIGRRRQVLCITHSAQLASFAGQHFRVSKEVREGRTYTRVDVLRGEERVDELARLLSGSASSVAREHAAALLQQSGSIK
ncbi:DNA repair protein RecN [Moorella thermoacetica]|uniref:DNA repair protein RecN n=1 Tax=Neomoorella thermoacetica TaxID=1525 RepID=A0A1J5JWF7_NEOTH|nr:DNA repair protein RecN [Moorella thermoacetica]OIQ08351.1 DNA repair protein RecN [Moorella thermoacetica]OIQ11035.1 DNA repair protein RecN [Moorella thermoacetica]OIQ60176.1 DNA repair protein RecN [Moorella thermoacetica]